MNQIIIHKYFDIPRLFETFNIDPESVLYIELVVTKDIFEYFLIDMFDATVQSIRILTSKELVLKHSNYSFDISVKLTINTETNVEYYILTKTDKPNE